MKTHSHIRLQKYLAQCGICSRRKAEQLIIDGRVRINGKIVSQPGITVHPGKDEVFFAGKKVTPIQYHYYLLNKPKGYVTTVSDPQGRPVVTSLIKGPSTRLFPVGRLDIDTEGALLLTNDGELTQKILHPKYETKKTYLVHVVGFPTRRKMQKLEQGLMIDNKITAPAKTRFRKKLPKGALFEITVHEGRKHQVKKMFQAIGHPVINLKRIAYGKLRIGNLPTGAYRKITLDELKLIFL